MQKISCEKTILKTGKPAADNAAYNDDNNNRTTRIIIMNAITSLNRQ